MYILIPGAIGWGLVIFLGLIGLIALICNRLKKRGKDTKTQICNITSSKFLLHNPIENIKNSDTNTSQLEINQAQQQKQSTASVTPIIMRRNQAFSVGTNSSISNQQINKNISYRVVAPEQRVEGLMMGSVYEDDENTLISNQAYEGNGESHYEDIV